MTAARPQMESLHQQMHANMLKLQQTQPTDPNYTSITSQVSQTHGSLQAQMLTQHAEIRAQVFKVLTPAQQTQLTTLEAQMQAHQARCARRPRTAAGRQVTLPDRADERVESCEHCGIGVYRWVAPIPSFLSRSMTLPWPTRWPVPTITR